MGTLISMLVLLTVPSQAAELNVGLFEEYSSIALALQAAQNGDVLVIHSPFNETGTNKIDGKSLRIRAEGDPSMIRLTSSHKDGFFSGEVGGRGHTRKPEL